jgi:hypothetical protein
MIRLVIAWTLLGCCMSPALATTTSPKNLPGERTLPVEVRRSAEVAKQASAAAQPQMAITTQTEILLNGRPCQYNAIPANAVIQLLEVSQDHRTVLRIHFSTPK